MVTTKTGAGDRPGEDEPKPRISLERALLIMIAAGLLGALATVSPQWAIGITVALGAAGLLFKVIVD